MARLQDAESAVALFYTSDGERVGTFQGHTGAVMTCDVSRAALNPCFGAPVLGTGHLRTSVQLGKGTDRACAGDLAFYQFTRRVPVISKCAADSCIYHPRSSRAADPRYLSRLAALR